MRAGLAPSKSRKGATCCWIRSTHSAIAPWSVQHPLGGRPRVTDQAGRAADQTDDAVPGQLQLAHHDQLDQIAEVQARRRGVEPAVGGDRAVGEGCCQRLIRRSSARSGRVSPVRQERRRPVGQRLPARWKQRGHRPRARPSVQPFGTPPSFPRTRRQPETRTCPGRRPSCGLMSP